MAICHDPKLDKYVPITTNYMLSHLKVYLTMLLVTGALHSCFLFGPGMLPELGTGPLSADSDWYQLSKIVQPKIWLRNIVIAFFYQSYLTCFGEGLIVAQSLVTGLQTHAIMDNPCLTARSFSDFWGSRWNLVIHQVLKDGVYLPVRKHFPKYVAVLASFVASGLFHEWLLWVFAYDVEGLYGCNEVDNDRFSVHCYQPSFGATSLFFVWQAFLIALEFSFLGRLSFWKHLPDPLVTLLILIIGGCTSHWFTEPYINSRFFLDAQILLNVFKAVK